MIVVCHRPEMLNITHQVLVLQALLYILRVAAAHKGLSLAAMLWNWCLCLIPINIHPLGHVIVLVQYFHISNNWYHWSLYCVRNWCRLASTPPSRYEYVLSNIEWDTYMYNIFARLLLLSLDMKGSLSCKPPTAHGSATPAFICMSNRRSITPRCRLLIHGP